MTDTQFSILDELYFVTDFEVLVNKLYLEPNKLKNELQKMIEIGWIKIFTNDKIKEIEYDSKLFHLYFDTYCYLATKKGLFEHNSN